MNQADRKLIRLANDIRQRLHALLELQTLTWFHAMDHPLEHARQIVALYRKLNLCRDRQYVAAAKRLRSRCIDILPDLIAEIETLQRIDRRPSAKVPPLSDLVADIQQLEQEFDSYEYNQAKSDLSITTEPIELENIDLGPFQIILHLPELARFSGRDVYNIEALEPHPAATDSGVTHPHVSHGRLCEGDAAVPIRAALQEGRICDFFLLARSVLQTYNGHSPYVSLENWQGQPCQDCGYIMSDSDSYYCESCDQSFCEECVSYCRHCDTSVCRGCLEECPHCHDQYCTRCMDKCSGCRQICCTSCLEDGLCPTCKEEQEQEKEAHEQDEREEQERQTAEQSNHATC